MAVWRKANSQSKPEEKRAKEWKKKKADQARTAGVARHEEHGGGRGRDAGSEQRDY